MNRNGSLSNVPGIGVRHRLVRGGLVPFGRCASADDAVPDTSDPKALQKVSGSASDRAELPVDSHAAIRDPRRCLTPASLRPA
jgi:hypothetical protein